MALKATLRSSAVTRPPAGRPPTLKHFEYENDQNRSNHATTSSNWSRDE